MDYLRDPDAIYRQSFANITAEADLDRFSDLERQVATRIIHSSGMIDIANDLVFSSGAVNAGVEALRAHAPILCDVHMVKHGIIARYLQGNDVGVAIAADAARVEADRLSTTLSAGGMEALRHTFAGAVVAIGNAPTALFHLLEGLESGWPAPALVLGFPVGFVGAEESKAALMANDIGLSFIALSGRRGGSAMAAAAVNALLIEAAR